MLSEGGPKIVTVILQLLTDLHEEHDPLAHNLLNPTVQPSMGGCQPGIYQAGRSPGLTSYEEQLRDLGGSAGEQELRGDLLISELPERSLEPGGSGSAPQEQVPGAEETASSCARGG